MTTRKKSSKESNKPDAISLLLEQDYPRVEAAKNLRINTTVNKNFKTRQNNKLLISISDLSGFYKFKALENDYVFVCIKANT